MGCVPRLAIVRPLLYTKALGHRSFNLLQDITGTRLESSRNFGLLNLTTFATQRSSLKEEKMNLISSIVLFISVLAVTKADSDNLQADASIKNEIVKARVEVRN